MPSSVRITQGTSRAGSFVPSRVPFVWAKQRSLSGLHDIGPLSLMESMYASLEELRG
jgi:hypothetical protein